MKTIMNNLSRISLVLIVACFLSNILVGNAGLSEAYLVDPQPAASTNVPTQEPVLSVVPSVISESIGNTFTINVTLTDVVDLFGIAVEFEWDPTILNYTDHLAHIPVDDYPDGVLNEGILWLRDDVDAVAGFYELGCCSFGFPTPPSFNGSGIVFDMTFEVLAEGVSGLDFILDDLANSNALPIDHLTINGTCNATRASDVAVIGVSTTKTGCSPAETIWKGQTVEINVTVENQGNFIETFNVTIYANATQVSSHQITINPDETKVLTYTWDTTLSPYGNYSITAVADIVPGETDVADNTFNYGWMFVTIAGDMDGDGDVDIFDIVAIADAYGTQRGDPKYNPNADIDDDGDVDIFDVVAAADNYGESW